MPVMVAAWLAGIVLLCLTAAAAFSIRIMVAEAMAAAARSVRLVLVSEKLKPVHPVEDELQVPMGTDT